MKNLIHLCFNCLTAIQPIKCPISKRKSAVKFKELIEHIKAKDNFSFTQLDGNYKSD